MKHIVSSRLHSLSLKNFLLFSLFFVVALLFVVIILIFYSQNEKRSIEIAREFEVVASTAVLNEFSSYLKNAEDNIQRLYELIKNQAINVDSKEDIQNHILALVQADERLNALYLADFNGNFYMVKRLKDKSVSSRYVHRTQDAIISTWKHENPKYEYKYPLYEKKSLEEGYDPRTRPWYKNAYSEVIFWTDPYIFFSDKIFGITGTRKIEIDGFEGVISVDLGLDYLETFVKKTYFSNIGSILIMNKEDQVITYYDNFQPKTSLEIDFSVAPSLLKLSDISISEGMNYILQLESQKNSDADDILKSFDDGFFEVLTGLVFPDSKINSLRNININSKTTAKVFDYKKDSFVYTYFLFDVFNGIDWNIYFLINSETLVGGFKNTLKLTIIILMLTFLIVAIIYSRVLRIISNRISHFSKIMNNISTMNLSASYSRSKIFYIKELDVMGNVYNRVIKSLVSFKKFIPEQVIRQTISQNVEINPAMYSNQSISILFSDIVSFSSISEKHTPKELSNALQIYFTELSFIVESHKGIVDKFIGDSIMALFGVFGKNFNHAEQACFSALKMQRAHKNINTMIAKKSSIVFKTRIGINTGPAIVGMLGSSKKLNYTAIGDSVNTASRLEGLNKTYGTDIIISESTKELLSPEFKVKKIDSVQIRGKEEKVVLYKLTGYSKNINNKPTADKALKKDLIN